MFKSRSNEKSNNLIYSNTIIIHKIIFYMLLCVCKLCKEFAITSTRIFMSHFVNKNSCLKKT